MNKPNLPPDVSFYIGDIPIYGELILAPMDGFSDFPFRSLTRSLGSAISYTEFINGIDITQNQPSVETKTKFSEDERPVAFQIFDDDVERICEAAAILMSRKPDIIDINLGCSAKNVANRGAGAALLKYPEKIEQIFRRLSDSLSCPITAKIRLGWDENTKNYIEIARIIEANGGKSIAVHARTKNQGYSGSADWDAITQIKKAVKIPVIANGDVKTVRNIDKIKEQTGCDGIMIGRAAIGNPWIFSRLNREEVPIPLFLETIRIHLQKMTDFYGEEAGVILFRKHAARYLSDLNLSREERAALFEIKSRQKMMGRIENYFI
ncbi:MAG: tRNA dihydrouridine synthase DusB [Anaerolineaceae bacterium]